MVKVQYRILRQLLMVMIVIVYRYCYHFYWYQHHFQKQLGQTIPISCNCLFGTLQLTGNCVCFILGNLLFLLSTLSHNVICYFYVYHYFYYCYDAIYYYFLSSYLVFFSVINNLLLSLGIIVSLIQTVIYDQQVTLFVISGIKVNNILKMFIG